MDPTYQPIPQKQELNTSYQPVHEQSPNPSGHHTALVNQPQQRRRTRIALHWLWHIICLLWLAPIAVLLYLNFHKHVIGASAWCPGGNCNAESTSSEKSVVRAQELDRQDHDLLGALQFAAKALEVWFMFVATSLVFDIGMLFAKKGRGLPVGYLLTHLEFGDIRYIFNPLLWTSPWPHRHSVPEKRVRIIKLYIFAVVTAFLTILANLMGPAAAVLVLPTLQWVDTQHVPQQTFNDTSAAYQPSNDRVSPYCNTTQLATRNYSCTYDPYGSSLDAWASQTISSLDQVRAYEDSYMTLGSSQEDALQFTFNATRGELIWVPNRQVLREMSHEFVKTQGLLASYDPPEFPEKMYNNSLQTLLQRQGPSLGFQALCHRGNVSLLQDKNDRWIACFDGWQNSYGSDTYFKCLRLGTDINDSKYHSQFFLENLSSDVPDNETAVGVYFANQAVYFNDTEDFGSGILKSCFADDTSLAACDWDHVFESADLPQELKNTSVNVGLVSYHVPGAPNPEARVYCDHVTYLSFPRYTADTSPQSNPQNLVTLNDLVAAVPNDTVPLVVNTDWFLAAYSADFNATLDGNEGIVKELGRVLPIAYQGDDDNDTIDLYKFIYLHLYALGQSLSLIDYSNFSAPANPDSQEAKEADKAHHIFYTWGTIHVWAYGLGGRTSYLGVAVVLAGSACVLARFLLGLFNDAEERSTVEVLASAFKHHHQGEFEGLEEESHLAKVRYQIVNDGEREQRFLPEKRTSRWSHAGRM
ncbi:MAG: hypothetical protein Q9225_007472 [Loekoesia sp. 1 TL-2023]